MGLSVKVLAILTVLTAHLVLVVCMVLLSQIPGCTPPCSTDTRYTIAVLSTLVLCILVLVTATLDNISWWSSSFPDAFMSTSQANQFLDRLLVTNPGYKVTIQQDFFALSGSKSVPKFRRKAHEMYKPKEWLDSTQYTGARHLAGAVIKLRLEVSPVDGEAREDLNKFIQELILTKSPGDYERKLLTGLCIEARVPKVPLFQGVKIPQLSLENKAESILLPLTANLHKMVGEPVRIFVYSDTKLCSTFCPALVSFKRILFVLVLLAPVLGTILSLFLADNTKQLIVRKRFSRRSTLADLGEDEMAMSKVVALLPSPQQRRLSRFSNLFSNPVRTLKVSPFLSSSKDCLDRKPRDRLDHLSPISETVALFAPSNQTSDVSDESGPDDVDPPHGGDPIHPQHTDSPPAYSTLGSPCSPSLLGVYSPLSLRGLYTPPPLLGAYTPPSLPNYLDVIQQNIDIGCIYNGPETDVM